MFPLYPGWCDFSFPSSSMAAADEDYCSCIDWKLQKLYENTVSWDCLAYKTTTATTFEDEQNWESLSRHGGLYSLTIFHSTVPPSVAPITHYSTTFNHHRAHTYTHTHSHCFQCKHCRLKEWYKKQVVRRFLQTESALPDFTLFKSSEFGDTQNKNYCLDVFLLGNNNKKNKVQLSPITAVTNTHTHTQSGFSFKQMVLSKCT